MRVNRTQPDKGCEKFCSEYKTEDAEFVTYNPISDEDMASLEKKYDVILEYSSYKDISVDSGDLKGTTLRVFGMPEKLNLCEVRDGYEPGTGEAHYYTEFCRAA